MTMRFAVLSDTHGDLSRMFAAADYIRALKPDALIHLGDFCADAEAMAKELRLELHAVAGNCDAGRTTHPAADVLEAEGARILLCHGHTYDVGETPQRLIWAAQEWECTAALFGHTHRQFLEKEDGVLLMNPGSLCRPRGTEAGLGLLTVEKGAVRGLLLPFSGRS